MRAMVVAIALLASLVAREVAAQPDAKHQADAAQAKPTLAVDTGQAELPLDAETAALRFPLLALAKRPTPLPKVELATVRYGGFLRADLMQDFAPPVLNEACDLVTLQVTTAALRFAGNYEVALQVRPDAGTGLAPSRLVLQINVPQTTLRPVEKLIVERRWQFFGVVEESQAPLVLAEASRRLPLTGLFFRQARISTFENDQVTGHLTFPDGPIPLLVRGEEKPIVYRTDGELPFGTVTGALEVSSPQLAAPLSIPFEVRSRVERAYIFLIIAAGLLSSWFLKVRLKSTIELGQARADAAPVAARAAKELEERQDPCFDNARSALASLQQAIGDSEVSAIGNAVTALEAAIAAASADFELRKAQAQKMLDDMRALVEPAWPVPPGILAAFGDAKVTTQGAAKSLGAGLPDEATVKIRAAEKQVARALGDATREWQRGVLACATLLAQTNQGISLRVQAEFVKRFDACRAAIEATSLTDLNSGSDLLLQFTPLLARTYASVSDVFLQLSQMMALEVSEVGAAFKKLTLPAPEAFEQLSKLTNDVAAKVACLAAVPVGDEVQNQLQELQASWRKALVAQASPQVQLTQLEQKITKREYVEAASTVISDRSPGQANQALGGPHNRLTDPTLVSGHRTAPASMFVLRVERTSEDRDSFVAIARQSKAQIRVAQAWQTLIAGVVASLSGYLLYQKAFVGSVTDIATIFLWAFGIDVTMDALLKFKGDAKAAEG